MTDKPRNVLVVTTGRADAGPMESVLAALDGRFTYIVCLETPSVSISAQETEHAIRDFCPDVMLVLGDRIETLAAVTAATMAGIPIAHIHGGEQTFGAMDDNIRHAITKLSCLHFVANMDAEKRLERLGERQIHRTGAPGLDGILEIAGPRNPEKYFAITWHPVTMANDDVGELLRALSEFQEYHMIFTGVNNDPGSDEVARKIHNWPGVDIRNNLGRDGYLRLMRNAAAVVGNSSSGIIEAPVLEVPTVDIGTREAGRARGCSVITCAAHRLEIRDAIDNALAFEGPFENVYGTGQRAGPMIAEILMSADLNRMKPWPL